MSELSLTQFTKLIVAKLEAISTNVTLQNPTDISTFPCTVLRTPMEKVVKTENGTPIKKVFSFSVEEWAQKQYDCMTMSNNSAIKLREYNIVKNSNDNIMYDDITKKYRLISNYEVNYNGITDSFELIK